MIENRAGAALLELVLASTIAGIVAVVAVTLLQLQSRIAHNISVRSERNDAARSAMLTLRAELRALSPGTDLRVIARDSVASRIFRGLAVVCGQRDERTYVRYRGLRLPDPAKDSAMQIGVENVFGLRALAEDSTACVRAPQERVLSFSWAVAAPMGSMWLLFESGAYHISGNAVRYRRGAESRQPITNEVFDERSSAFTAVADSIVRAVGLLLNDRATGAAARTHIRLLNSR